MATAKGIPTHQCEDHGLGWAIYPHVRHRGQCEFQCRHLPEVVCQPKPGARIMPTTTTLGGECKTILLGAPGTVAGSLIANCPDYLGGSIAT